MNARARSRNAASIGSNQPSNRATPASASGCTASGFVVGLVMAWSPARRASTGLVRVGQPGDYATPNSNQPRDGTVVEALGDTVKSEPVVAALRAAAENGATTSERGAALLALGRLQADGATDQMVAVMADERTDPVLRYQSARALQMLDGRADPATVVPVLEAQLSARDPGLRYNAARALVAIEPDSVSPEAFDGLFGDPRIEAEIDRLVADVATGGAARATALSRLGQIGPPAVSAVPALVSQLTHGASSDREAVAETIVEISRAALEDLSSTARLLSASGANQERVVAGLGATVQGVEKAIASLTAALQRPADRTVEVAAATALGELDGLASRLTTSLLETAAGDGTGVMNAQAADGLVRSYLAAATPPTPATVVAAGD